MTKKICFHCHEEIEENSKIWANIDNQNQPMCCYGCKAVAEFIHQQGYSEFYHFRADSQPASKAQVSDNKWLAFDQDIQFNTSTKATTDKHHAVTLYIQGMYCSACGWLIDKHLRSLAGIKTVKLNSVSKLLQIEFDKDSIKLSQILTAINYLGYVPTISQVNNPQQHDIDERKKALKRLVLAGFGMMFIMTISVPLYSSEYSGMEANIKRFFLLISLLVATLVYFYSGKVFVKNAYRDLKNKHLGMDVPVALSISLAYVVSCWNVLTKNGELTYFDSMVMFVFFLLAGRFVEMTVRHKGMSVEDALSNMIPASVRVIRNQIEQTIPYDKIHKGDVILVQAGDVIAVDGEIISGEVKIDESMLTGESQPVSKKPCAQVMAGSVVNSGAAQIKSIAIGTQTILASLTELLHNAQLQKPKTLLLVDNIASWFVAIVLLLAAATAGYYALYAPDKIMLTTLAVLVATCPCALSLATPLALTVASVRLMKQGILVNNLDAITAITKIKHWFFDKTGTLTEAHMSLLKIHNFSDSAPQQILRIMAALEHGSVHPIASAFNDYYGGNISVQDYTLLANKGIQAKIGQHSYKAGIQSWCDADSDCDIDSTHSIIYLSKNEHLIAAFELHNQLRQGSEKLVQALQKRNLELVIISGDKPAAVKAIAKQLHIDTYYSEQTPQQKIDLIKHKQAQSRQTIMLGDGINDAPVLAQSDVSISFSQGTLLARAAADFIILSNSFNNLESLLHISKKTNNIIKQNIFWALLYNFSVTPLAMMGLLAPWMAAIGMSASSLLVILNARRLLNIKAPDKG